jgi:CcmD family protein
MDNLGYLFAVFGIVWVLLFAYILILINGQKRLQKEIQALKMIIKEKELDK